MKGPGQRKPTTGGCCNALNKGIRAAYVPQVLVKMRLGGASNRSLKNILQKSREDYRALKANRVGGLGALAWKNLSKLPQFLRR